MSHESSWWSSLSPKLVQEQIINNETSANISSYFAKLKNRTPVDLILIACGVLATLCISGGIISLFAHNWDDFSKPVRLILSMIPILAGLAVFGKALFQHSHSKVWMECASVFLVLMTGSSIALISMLYNLGGTFERFLLVWMLTAIPIVYLANSSLAAIIYSVGITVWAYMKFIAVWGIFSMGYKDPSILLYWLLFAALIPHFLKNVKPGVQTLRATMLGWFLGIALLYGSSVAFLQHQSISLALLTVLLYTLGKYFYGGGTYFWFRPFQTLALIYILFMGIAFTFEFYLRTTLEYNHYTENPYGSYFLRGDNYGASPGGYTGMSTGISFLLIAALVAGNVLMFLKNHKRTQEFNWAIAAYPVAVSIGLFIAYSNYTTGKMEMATWWFNAFMLFMGAYYLAKGVNMRINGVISMGIFMLILILGIRYFDTEISFFAKGLLYIIIGAALLFFNYVFDKKSGES